MHTSRSCRRTNEHAMLVIAISGPSWEKNVLGLIDCERDCAVFKRSRVRLKPRRRVNVCSQQELDHLSLSLMSDDETGYQ